jgi:uncharacterized protein YerC
MRKIEFWDQVLRGADEQCWLWQGSTTANGYGTKLWRGHVTTAHRIAYELANRKRIPGGKVVCHSCDTPQCCNPRHLWIGTQRENLLDMRAKGRANDRCYRGEEHPTAKFSDAMARRIRKMRAKGMTYIAISAKTGVSKTHAARIAQGTSRKSA